MSSYVIKYELVGQDSTGLRGGAVQFRSAISSAPGTAVAYSLETFECLVVLLCSPPKPQVFPR